MSTTTVFQTTSPSAILEDFDAWPEVREARKLYAEQKLRLGALARRAQQSGNDAKARHESQEMAIHLHNLSGTAAHFGEAAFGLRAGELERELRGVVTAEALRPWCIEIGVALVESKPG